MSTPLQAMRQLLADDGRFSVEAYQFIRESLQFASENPDKLGPPHPKLDRNPDLDRSLDGVVDNEPSSLRETVEEDIMSLADQSSDDLDLVETSHHVTGGQLCQACRLYALDQYGYLAPMVLSNWGIESTSDLGDLVYNLIRIGQMRKSESDRREDFDDVFDFADAFEPQFERAITTDV